MRFLVISGTPKHEGLCDSCVKAVLEGAKSEGVSVEVERVCDKPIARCAMCEDGWGDCQKKHTCRFGEDGFTDLQRRIAQADAVALVTPVYWWEMTESMKAFFDRFRRCEATRGEKGAMAGKTVLLVASPGGSGNGMLSCLEQMERLCRHLRARIFDYIGVNRWNKDYKLTAIRSAAKAIASGKIPDDIIRI
ncbi:MAG: flavodoxin family protein [Methanothrix sp.]|nr:flavodoxin family protein [Methanothrix sp.]